MNLYVYKKRSAYKPNAEIIVGKRSDLVKASGESIVRVFYTNNRTFDICLKDLRKVSHAKADAWGGAWTVSQEFAVEVPAAWVAPAKKSVTISNHPSRLDTFTNLLDQTEFNAKDMLYNYDQYWTSSDFNPKYNTAYLKQACIRLFWRLCHLSKMQQAIKEVG